MRAMSSSKIDVTDDDSREVKAEDFFINNAIVSVFTDNWFAVVSLTFFDASQSKIQGAN